MDFSYLNKEILGSPAWSWAVYAGTSVAIFAAIDWYEKNHEKVSKFIFWKVINRIYSGTLKGELKRMEKDNKNLENKVKQ